MARSLDLVGYLLLLNQKLRWSTAEKTASFVLWLHSACMYTYKKFRACLADGKRASATILLFLENKHVGYVSVPDLSLNCKCPHKSLKDQEKKFFSPV